MPDTSNIRKLNSKPSALWRVLSVLPYAVPMMGVLAFAQSMSRAFPFFDVFMQIFGPLLRIYYANSLTPFVTFFVLFLVVVRNARLPHFVRFNTMQSILIDICVMLGGLIIQYLPLEVSFSPIGPFFNNITFMGGLTCILYSVWFCFAGVYADIPIISEAVYVQIR